MTHRFLARPTSIDRLALVALWAILGIGLALTGATAQAQSLQQTGQQIAAQNGDAVITVKLVLMMKGSGQEQSFKAQTCGTVISPEGLVVIPLHAIDPGQLAKRLLGPAAAMMSLPIDCQVKEAKYKVGKQPEIAAAVVLRDPDLGVALLRPLVKPTSPMKAIDLSQADSAQALDSIIIMARLGNVADNEIGLVPGAIQAVIKKPRQFFIPTGGFAGFGVPAFSAKGKPLGVFVVRTSTDGTEEMASGLFSLNLSQIGLLPVILPAADLAELASQAPEKAEPTSAATDSDTTASAQQKSANNEGDTTATAQQASADAPKAAAKEETPK